MTEIKYSILIGERISRIMGVNSLPDKSGSSFMLGDNQESALYVCSSCGGTLPLNSFYMAGTNRFSYMCSNCRNLNSSSILLCIGFTIELEHRDALPAVSVSRKRSSDSQQPFAAMLPSKLCSLSESAAVPPKDPYAPISVSSIKETGDVISKPAATPVKSTYHYVVPRSCWVCSTTKLTKQKMREVYQATLVYHRSTKDTEQQSSSKE